MNRGRIKEQWNQRKGKAVFEWRKIMNNEFANIAGKTEQLVRTLQDKYGIAKGEAKRQVDEFKKIVKYLKKSDNKPKRLQKSSSKKIKLIKKTSKKRNK